HAPGLGTPGFLPRAHLAGPAGRHRAGDAARPGPAVTRRTARCHTRAWRGVHGAAVALAAPPAAAGRAGAGGDLSLLGVLSERRLRDVLRRLPDPALRGLRRGARSGRAPRRGRLAGEAGGTRGPPG